MPASTRWRLPKSLLLVLPSHSAYVGGGESYVKASLPLSAKGRLFRFLQLQ